MLQDSPNSVAMLHSLHLQVSVFEVLTHKVRFQPSLPAAINAGRKTGTALLYSQTSPKQTQVYFSKEAVIKSLSVDMSMIRRRMLSTSSQTDEWGINTKIELVILHVFPSSLQSDKLRPMAKGGTGSQNSLEEQKLGICC